MSYKFKTEYKEQIFGNSDVSKTKFAENIGVSKEHLSQVINGHYKCSKTMAILFTVNANMIHGNKYDMHDLFYQV